MIRWLLLSLLLASCSLAPVSDCVLDQLESAPSTRYAHATQGPSNAAALMEMIPEEDRAIGDEPVLWLRGADGSWRYFRVNKAVFYDLEVKNGTWTIRGQRDYAMCIET